MASLLPDLSGFTILVVEDDPDGLRVLSETLTFSGAQVLTAADTTAARGYIETTKIDLLSSVVPVMLEMLRELLVPELLALARDRRRH